MLNHFLQPKSRQCHCQMPPGEEVRKMLRNVAQMCRAQKESLRIIPWAIDSKEKCDLEYQSEAYQRLLGYPLTRGLESP